MALKFHRVGLDLGLAVLCVLATGCASTGSIISNVDAGREKLGERFVSFVDKSDKVFGEARVEDRQQLARAKVGLEAEVREGMDTDWSVPANFRWPMPALARRWNVFIDVTGSPDTSNLSDINAAAGSDGSLSATVLRRLSDTFDFGATLGIHGGPDIGPEVFVRYEEHWDPWMLFAEQRGYWRTDNGWGGRTLINLDYTLPDQKSSIRFANKADYWEELHNVNYKSGLLYRRQGPWETYLSAEAGVEYNPYVGDAEAADDTSPQNDDDQYYARLRAIGNLGVPWLEWELMPGFYYMWQHEDKQVWGINARLSIMYEGYLRGPQD